ncbi:MAG TPA: 4-hydroxy-tetrahydrodipicolinate reductase [Candidatus Limnocylindria bacterium]
MSEAVRVVVAGASGRMGQLMASGLGREPGIEVVGGFHRSDPPATVDRLLGRADALVDFTVPAAAHDILLRAIAAGVRPVSGTSGVTEATLAAVDEAARERGIAAMWAPNFRIGGVLMEHLARIAARTMKTVEIVEAHNDRKKDAPSGTAVSLARAMREARGSDFPDPPVDHEVVRGTRGGVEGGVRIHSLRLPLFVGRHEIVFAGADEILTISHDVFGREAYVPTVALALHEVMRPERVGLIRGAATLFGLDE